MEVHVFHLMPWPAVEHEVAWPFSTDAFDPELGNTIYNEYFDQLEHCADLGFDALAFNEHHYTAYGLLPSPNVAAAAMAARTDDVGIAVYGNVLPIRGNPIRVAEELAMLDHISDGRLISGFVRGLPTEYAAYNVDMDESRGRFAEAWDLILRAWTAEEPFDWDGEFWQYEDVYIWPRPYQQPHPPLWMPAESEQSIRYAAERRVPIARTLAGVENLANTYDRYREIAEEEFGWTPGDEHFGVSRMVYVAETDERARAEAAEHVEYYYDKLVGGLLRSAAVQQVGDTSYREENAFAYEERAVDASEKGEKAINFDFDELVESGEIVVGSAESVIAELERHYEVTGGFERLIARFQFGSLPHDLAMANAERFADEVLPEIRGL